MGSGLHTTALASEEIGPREDHALALVGAACDLTRARPAGGHHGGVSRVFLDQLGHAGLDLRPDLGSIASLELDQEGEDKGVLDLLVARLGGGGRRFPGEPVEACRPGGLLGTGRSPCRTPRFLGRQ